MRRILPLRPLLLVAIALTGPVASHAQEAGATIAGTVRTADTPRPIDGAFVSIEGTEIAAITDSLGRYRLVGVPPGPQVVRVQRIGFAVARVQLTIAPRATLTRDFELATHALEMEDISVTVDAVSRARGELGTASVIELEAIQNQTATSLAGVLELLPGVPLEPPGLDGVQQFALRSAPTSGRSTSSLVGSGGGILAGDLASFGTVIVLDGVPLSNNANLQTLGPRGGVGVVSAAGGGVDLRRIPANTIERVEVIRGLPSARWGDLTQGAVIVDTRAGPVPPELGGQFDSRTLEGSLLWGTSFGGGGHDGTLTFDAARTRTRPGVADDVALRLTGQLSHRAGFGGLVASSGAPSTRPDGDDDGGDQGSAGAPAPPQAAAGRAADQRLTLDTRIDAFRLFDDRPMNPNIRLNTSLKARDWGIRVNERARFRWSETTRLEFTGAFSAVNQDARTVAEKVRGAIPFTDRTTEGRQEGFFVLGPYIAEVDLDGGPRLFFGRLELETDRPLFGLDHELRAGLILRKEWNSGDGVQFDISRPLQVTFNGVQGFDRPRSLDDVGDLVTGGYYLDDRVRLDLGGQARLELQGGLRLDLLHEGSGWFDGVRDAFLQPRLNAELAPRPWLRLRGGWGRVAKAPTLGSLFPAPQYYDVINVNQFTNDPVERLAVLTTFIEDPTNDDLGWIRATKAEAGVELGVGRAEISLVAFRDRIDGGVAFDPQPSSLLRESFALTDSIIGNGVKPEIILPATGAEPVPILIDRPANIVEQVNRGFELIASFPELRPIRTRLHVTGAWVETRQRTEALDFGPRSEFGNFQLQRVDERAPFWDPITEFGERALMTYRVIHHQPELGLVLTATVQHNLHDETRDVGQQDTLSFAGYITRLGELVRVPASERGRPEFQDLRVPRSGSLIRQRASPSDWFMSVQVSKTLPLDGQLNFWAFNLLDRRGIVNEPRVRPRPFARVRFGLEVLLPLNSMIPGRGG